MPLAVHERWLDFSLTDPLIAGFLLSRVGFSFFFLKKKNIYKWVEVFYTLPKFFHIVYL